MKVRTWLQGYAAELPQIAAVLNSIAPVAAPAKRVDKRRHCANPGCTISGEGRYNLMKKCGRCKAVLH